MKNPLTHNIIFRSYRVKRYKEIAGPVRGNVEKACQLVQAEAKENVARTGGQHPRILTGKLRDGIKINIWRKRETIKGYVGITRDLFYGRILEFGTIHMPPYPWLFPALKAKENEVEKLLRGK